MKLNLNIMEKICLFFVILISFSIFKKYYIQITHSSAGVDILWRLTEAHYFLKGINPFDVFSGKLPPIKEFGIPATYSFVSYILVSPLTIFNDKQLILFLYSFFEFICLFFSFYILNKFLNDRLFFITALTLAIVFFSLSELEHITYLNYGIISTFGLLLLIYSIHNNATSLLVLGIILLGLKPSIAIPTFIYLILSKNWRALGIFCTIYSIIIILTSYQLNTPLYELLKQLKYTQEYFSDNGFFRNEGILLFARPFIWRKITLIGIIFTTIVLLFYQKKLNDPINSFILIISLSLSFYFNQESAWLMAYPILFYSLYAITLNKDAIIPTLVLILFLITPSHYQEFEAMGYKNYMIYHNLMRFSLLLIASLWLIYLRIKYNKFCYQRSLVSNF